MRAIFINENIQSIFSPKIPNPEDIIKDKCPDIRANNERVKYLFSGDLSKVLNLSKYYEKFFNDKVDEIQKMYLEIYRVAVLLNSTKLKEFMYRFLDKTYPDPMARSERKYGGNHFDHIKETFKYFWWYDDVIDMLHSDFYDIVKDYLDKRGIKMIDPDINSSVITTFLDKPLGENEIDELYNILKNSECKYKILSSKETNLIYPFKINT